MKDPAALFFIDTWLTSTAEMDSDVRGWYLNLILHQFDKKDLPNDIEKLAVLAGVKFSEYERFKHVFEQVFKHKFKQNSEGRLENDVAKEILRKRESFKDKRSMSGKISYFLKYIKQNFNPKKDVIQFIKDNVDLTDVDLKDEQVLKHVFEHLFELYINGNGDGNKDIITNWKSSFEIYLQEMNKVYDEMINDIAFIQEQEKFNPGVDILLSLEKAKNNFWGTETGWKHKKKSRGKDINWKLTFINAISLNKVYKKYGSPTQTNYKSDKNAETIRAAENLQRELAAESRKT